MAGVAAILQLPQGTSVHDHQVAGHRFQDGRDTIGMLKEQRDGTILKAANKPVCGRREIEFYERVKRAEAAESRGGGGSEEVLMLLQLRQLMPEYRGTVQIQMENETIDFIRLGDITSGMTEPCVMDIKIGQRTWDPLATIDKIQMEEGKYQDCKNTLGLCIPGFQVYNVRTGACKRFGKDFGKNLNATTIKTAISTFLNAEHGLCRALLVQILSGLWSIQKWARSQRSLRLYSSSVLISYDARLLRNHLDVQRKAAQQQQSPTFSSSLSPSPSHSPKSGAGKQHNARTPTTNNSTATSSPNELSPFDWAAAASPQQRKGSRSPNGGGGSSPSGSSSPSTPVVEMYRKVQRNHSMRNNYDEDLKAIRENYTFMLDNLIGGFASRTGEWVHVKMIDFAHVFEADTAAEPDTNYLRGIESAVRLFEEFLRECQ